MNLIKWLGYASYFIPSIPFGIEAYQSIAFKHNSSLPNVSQKITMELQPFFKKIGLREDLIIHEAATDDHLTFDYSKGVDYLVQSKGTNYLNCDAVIHADPELCNFERDGCNFFIKHEAVHIKHQDNLMIHAIPFFSSLISASIASTLVSILHRSPINVLLPRNSRSFFVIVNFVVQASANFATQASFTQSVENRADDLAIAEGSVEELKGGRRILMALQSCFSDGYQPEMPLHRPSFATRIQKIEASLIERHVQMDESQERIKMILLKEILKPLLNKKAFGYYLDFNMREKDLLLRS